MLSEPLKKRIAGVLLMALGVGALSAPLTVGRWSLAALGIPVMVLSVAEAYAALPHPTKCPAGSIELVEPMRGRQAPRRAAQVPFSENCGGVSNTLEHFTRGESAR